MDVKEWTAQTKVTQGRLDDLVWEMIADGVQVPDGPRRVGALLRDAGWTRAISAEGRIWYAPGRGKAYENTQKAAALSMVCSFMRERGEATQAEIWEYVKERTGRDDLAGKCVILLGERGRISRRDGEIVDGKPVREKRIYTWRGEL